MKPEHDVGLLGGEFGGAVDADGVESNLGLAGLDQLVDVERGMIEGALRHRIQRVAGSAGVEHVRHQHGVVVGRDHDAAQRKKLPGEFQIVTDFEHAHVFEQRL